MSGVGGKAEVDLWVYWLANRSRSRERCDRLRGKVLNHQSPKAQQDDDSLPGDWT